ncbi:MAG: hypothetical protein P8080_07205 [Gammaproteobacteria bacterium]
MSFFAELKRRNVFRAAAAYVAVAWLVIQVAETVFPAYGFSDEALRVLITLLAVGFVPAVVLAWVFEITPEGLRRDRDIDPGSELSLRTRKMLDRGIVVVLALGIGYFAIDKFILDPARDEALVEQARQEGRTEAFTESFGDKSIAVLPFANRSPDPDQEYFAEGVADEVLNLLTGIDELRVIARSSAFAFKGQDLPVSEIAEILGVTYVLEGAVYKASEQVRVNARLVDARSNTQLWSESWSRPLRDIFAVQEELASEVASQLRVQLLDLPGRGADISPQAYELYLKGRFMSDSQDPDKFDEAIAALRQVVEMEPGYSAAWAELALTYYRVAVWLRSGSPGDHSLTFPEAWTAMQQAAQRAAELDPAGVLDLMINAYMTYYEAEGDRQDFAAGAALLERALTRAPANPRLLTMASEFATIIGRPELGVRLGEASTLRDPLCGPCRAALLGAYREAGRYADAQALIEGMEARRGGEPRVFDRVALALDQGQPEEALALLGEPDGELPTTLGDRVAAGFRIRALTDLERREDAGAELDRLAETAVDHTALTIAGLYAQLGQPDEAFEWLERTVEIDECRRFRLNFLSSIREDFEAYQEDPRWTALTEYCSTTPQDWAAIEFAPALPF